LTLPSLQRSHLVTHNNKLSEFLSFIKPRSNGLRNNQSVITKDKITNVFLEIVCHFVDVLLFMNPLSIQHLTFKFLELLLQPMPTSCENVIEGIQNKNNFNTNEILVKFKIYPKRKSRMNIPLCRLVGMPIVKPMLKIDVLKME
jgi:hypothetical protein